MELITDHIGIILRTMAIMNTIFICVLRCKEDEYELTALLNAIDDSYYDFVSAMINYAAKKPTRQKLLVDYIKNTPNLKSSDVVRFVSEQNDFFEDAAYMEVE